ADDNRIGRVARRTGGPKEPLQIALERAQQIVLDEDVPLEIADLVGGEPARVVRPLDHVAMRVARVTVRAAELAADERVERPEIHARLLRRVEHRAGREGNELGSAQPLVENREGGWANGRL